MTKGKNKDFDDLDDVLDDLLAEDTPTTKKAAGRKHAKPGTRDDDFYSSLAAAAAENEMSDVSDADPAEMAKSIEGLDDMDAALFGSKKITPRSPRKTQNTPAKKPPPAGNDDWLFGDSQPNPAKSIQVHTPPSHAQKDDASPVRSANRVTPKKKILDFDEDDPLAGLLSDEEDDKPKITKPSLKKALAKQDSQDDDSDKSSSSKRLEVERPPTRSGPTTPIKKDESPKKPIPKKKPADDISFDDDDVLGGMGLDSPRQKSAPKSVTRAGDDPRPGGAMSILDDLLGGSRVNKHLERPGVTEKREFIFDKKTNTGSAQKDKPKEMDDDFAFGSYMPSAATTGSRPSSRRSVRFEDDDIFGDKPSSRGSSAGRKQGPGSYLEVMIDNDDRDWLDIASDAPQKETNKIEDKRPNSDGGIREKPPSQNLNDTSQSEPVDWLGFSRLGSPDVTPRSPEVKRNTKFDTKEKVSAKSDPQKSAVFNDSDDELPFPRAATATPQTRTEEPAKEMKSEDKKKDDPLDYLGLGDDIDPDDIFKSTAPKSYKPPEDLFTSPQKQMSASLPWDSERPRARRDRNTNSQRSTSAERTKPSMRADSPRDFAGVDTELSRNKSPGAGDSMEFVASQQPPDAVLPTAADTLFSSPNLFDDTPDLTHSHQSRASTSISQTAPNVSSMSLPAPMTYGMTSVDAMRNQEAMRQQQERIREQQNQMLRQQQQQQAELQRQFQQQRENELRLIQEQQRKLMQQQMPINMSYMPSTMPMGGGSMMDERVRTLEMEKTHMYNILETLKSQHQQELSLVEDSYKKRLEMLEDIWQKREQRLREENDLLSRQSMLQLQRMENEKTEMVMNQMKHIDAWEQEKLSEIKKIKSLHNDTLEELRAEHQKAIERVRRSKDQELEAAVSASDHARHLQAVISRVEDHASNLDQLQEKVEGKHSVHLEQRETAARIKDQQLKSMQERLERQQHENEQERARLQALITRLEIQLTEQTRQTEEEKWLIRQEAGRLQSAQKGLENERKLLMEQIERDRIEIERAKSKLLEEQRSILTQLAEERRSIAEERAQFNISQRLKVDQELKDSVQCKMDSAEVEKSLRFVNDEKSRLSAESRQLEIEKDKIRLDRDQLEQQKQMFQIEREKLEHLALDINHKSHEIQDMCLKAAEVRDEGQSSLSAAQKKQAELQIRDESITKQLKILREKEKQIAEERLSLAKEKIEFGKHQHNMLCVNCRTPVRDTDNVLSGGGVSYQRMSPAAKSLYTALGADLQGEVQGNLMTSISSAIEMDKNVRQWRRSAQKDQEFLSEESMFLQTLKATPYHNAGS